MNESIPSNVHPAQAAQNPVICDRERGVRAIRTSIVFSFPNDFRILELATLLHSSDEARTNVSGSVPSKKSEF